jgi:hypothetical protein
MKGGSMLIRFDHPAETRRPNGKSQRFDVFGLKIERPLTLFHRHAINTWIDLERAPEVSWYCERPLLIDHAPFKRLVDFYAIRHGEEEIWFVLTENEERHRFLEEELAPGFVEWCRQSAIKIRAVEPSVAEAAGCVTDNWAQILRELSAFGRYVPPQLTDAIRLEICEPQTLAELESIFPNVDPILLKVASFSLLHRGLAACPGLETQRFSAALPFAAA